MMNQTKEKEKLWLVFSSFLIRMISHFLFITRSVTYWLASHTLIVLSWLPTNTLRRSLCPGILFAMAIHRTAPTHKQAEEEDDDDEKEEEEEGNVSNRSSQFEAHRSERRKRVIKHLPVCVFRKPVFSFVS